MSDPIVSDAPDSRLNALTARAVWWNDPPPPETEPDALPDGTRDLPATDTQLQLWLSHTLAPSGSLNDRLILRVEGDIEPSALARALSATVAAHPLLRTLFRFDGHTLRQHVLPAGAALAVRDLPKERGGNVDPGAAVATARETAAGVFALDREPPLRLALFRVRPGLHLLALAMHHIASDNDSPLLLLTELAERYRAELLDAPARLPQAADYTETVRAGAVALGAEGRARLVRHWADRLRDTPPAPRLPLGSGSGGERGSVHVTTGPALGGAVRARAASLKVSLFALTCAVLRITVWRSTRAADVLVASPFSQRGGPGTDGVIGPLLTTLALRNPLAPERTFAELARAERGEVLTAMVNGHVPHGTLVAEAARRDLGALPSLPGLLFSYEERQPTPREFAGLPCEAQDIGPIGSALDLSVKAIGEPDGSLTVHWLHTAFADEAVSDLAEGYLTLLRAVVDEPDRPLASLPEPFPPPPPAPAPGGEPAGPPGAAAPATPTERAVAAIWAELLEVDAVTDVFASVFELGAHSLTMARAAARLTDEFGVEVRTVDLFTHDSVDAQAELLDELLLTGLDAVEGADLAEALDQLEHRRTPGGER
ncbi:condensation domain-containing protein [Streptomyces triticirhizae]|uniref:Carrier domain-containing protein n=1 Tax=Streptomyces triticirhizae TaxID=2483353 RepID=A0A3M2L538_9ACTN|nr:condensation domain-containing protein [Streptomyces triticirhizae]RMI32504.1 hypothetical protein EBN88_25025 [Streptomyces triticirhizae]